MPTEPKTLDITDIKGARATIPDINVFGNGDLFALMSKASSESQGWMKSTKVMPIEGGGAVVQVSTQQKNPDGSYAVAEALAYVPHVVVMLDEKGNRVLANPVVALSMLN